MTHQDRHPDPHPDTDPVPDEVSQDRLGMAVLTEDECWDRLESEPVGRLAIIADRRPHLVPLNHVVRNRQLLFVSVPGTKLHDVLQQPGMPAAFEIDRYDATDHSGWSVVVNGSLHPVQDLVDHTQQDVRGRPIWLDGYRDRSWLRLTPEQVEGRELRTQKADR